MVVIDGEHYPPVVRAAIDELTARGHEVAAAVMAGGTEKLTPGSLAAFDGLDVRSGPDPRALLDQAILDSAPDEVVDLSDEPVLDYERRHALASVALWRGVAYRGADFVFTPPPRPHVCAQPSIAMIGTGKRTGKTAVAGFAARTLHAAGESPVVVAMGRGGPPEPEVLRGDQITLEARDLIAFADAGRHAASDYIEDALLARIPTVGCRRCGGGLAGAVEFSNVGPGIELAGSLGRLMLLEGSGAAIPPAHADASLLVVPASIPLGYLTGYMGVYRLLLADTVVVTMAEEPFGSPPHVSAILSFVQEISAWRAQRGGSTGGTEVIRTVFRPAPIRSVETRKAYVATTAPAAAGPAIKRHLEEEHGCRVVGMTHSLSDRDRLEAEMAAAPEADVLLVEIKAAGIDVAARRALEKGLEVVFMDNVPVGISGDDPADAVRALADTARERFVSAR